MRINPGKNCALVFLIANYQQFCNIFSTKYWVGYFSPSLLVQVFFIQNCLAGIVFSKSPPPPHQKLNGRPLAFRNYQHKQSNSSHIKPVSQFFNQILVHAVRLVCLIKCQSTRTINEIKYILISNYVFLTEPKLS